jgi:hypothetical protein
VAGQVMLMSDVTASLSERRPEQARSRGGGQQDLVGRTRL